MAVLLGRGLRRMSTALIWHQAQAIMTQILKGWDLAQRLAEQKGAILEMSIRQVQGLMTIITNLPMGQK